MTVNSTAQDDDPPMNAQEVTRCLERELRLRGDGSSAVGSPCSPPTSHLLQQLQQLPCITNPCSQRPYLRGLGRGRGSPSPSGSSDGTSRDLEVGSLTTATSGRSLFGLGSPRNRIASPSRVLGQVLGRGEPMPNSPMPAPTIGRGRNTLPATAVIAKGPKPKRKRASKKPPTKIVEATQEEFRATVQQLTGCPTPAIVRPQARQPAAEVCHLERAEPERREPERREPERGEPERRELERPQAAVPIGVPIGVDVVAIRPARPESMPASRLSVPSPSPAVSNRVPEASFSFRDSSSGSSGRSSLNYTMGYEQASFLFMDPEDVRPEDSGIPDDDFKGASTSSYGQHRDTIKDASNEVGERKTATTGASYQAATLSVFESVDKRDDIPREHTFLSSASLGIGSPPSPSRALVPNHRPTEASNEYEMEFDPDLLWMDFPHVN